MADSIGRYLSIGSLLQPLLLKAAILITAIDRVFVKAISTIRALSTRTGYGSLPRPPVDSRIKLYGLYKQATEGNVEGIMERPTGHRPEDESARRKWDAWKGEEGASKTEAKRRYIAFLIDTMKKYASGTHEARELLSELEYLWDQIKDMEPSPSPPITPRLSTYNGSMYGSTAYFDDRRSIERDVSALKVELAGALKKVNDELERVKGEKDKKDWPENVKKIVIWLMRIVIGIIKRLIVDLLIVLMILNFLKYKNGIELNIKGENAVGMLNKAFLWVFKLLNKANLLGFNRLYINVD
ncbi:CYFA0S28e00606g1_1 [Cyberlindnera fabianii]|uniref:CYFA0S28e00606g1_1 n=1 Tax=Cyberlindnera fabianii TaxID=36022 RepID=A0A061BAW5_CYBFA|nr:CYFA0S28e00606g1_1 [Cyberlindnera fabianii]